MDATYQPSNSPVPFRPPQKRTGTSWAAWLFSEILVPLLLGLGVGAGVLAPCGHGQCERQATK